MIYTKMATIRGALKSLIKNIKAKHFARSRD